MRTNTLTFQPVTRGWLSRVLAGDSKALTEVPNKAVPRGWLAALTAALEAVDDARNHVLTGSDRKYLLARKRAVLPEMYDPSGEYRCVTCNAVGPADDFGGRWLSNARKEVDPESWALAFEALQDGMHPATLARVEASAAFDPDGVFRALIPTHQNACRGCRNAAAKRGGGAK